MASTAAAAPPASSKLPFGTVARWVTVATVLVVLLGAVVRITGSGAGCGQHWPTCHGEVAHLPKSVETWIELSHRTTSGLDFLGVLGLAVLAFRLPPRHPARIAAFAALALIIVEVLIGARLVLLNLVGSNMSFDRVVVMPAHLVTTSLLIGALAAATYFGSPERLERDTSLTPHAAQSLRRALLWSAGAGALLLLVSMTGAITALGDTVYPVRGAGALEHLQNDQAASSHLLGKLRVIHPLLALLGVAGLWHAASRARDATPSPAVQKVGFGLYVGGGLALLVGVSNIWLGAPGYIQVTHLFVACLLWLGVVILTAMLWDLLARRDAHLR
ncbi:MAG: Protoheme farnesyltransferase [Polyangiaceae bacterium]|jgi:heme A synthase|nr:Protoheme farnesyltransferase [Polyangiaceae bacterium]